MAPDLLGPWCRVLGDGVEVVRAGQDLLARYAEPHRRYHDTRHLAELLTALDVLTSGAPPPAPVVLAAYWHDAVHEPPSTDDERRSAAVAATVLESLGKPASRTAEVVRLVLLTAGHDPHPGDADGALLSDADLWVLASPPERYAAYAADVRQEYASVPDEAFRAGRTAVLRSLVDRPAVYASERGRRRWEAAARRNVLGELSRLAGAVGADPPP
jgi:predicted metal-dependent HD superfamily phosphohydrolase